MNRIKSILDFLNERIFSSTYQIRRLIVLLVVIIGLLLLSFGSYYYYDRYYRTQQPMSQQSVSQAEAAVRADPQNPDKRISLAEVYMLNRRFDDAILQANQVMTAQPNNERAWIVLGIAYANSNRPAQAIDPLTKYFNAHKDDDMAALNRSLISAAYYLGDSYLQLNQPDKAIPPLVKAVAWSQSDADAMYKLGMAFMGIKDYASAIEMFTRATNFVPNFTEAYQAMEKAYTASNQQDLATYARAMVAFSQKDYQAALPLLLQVTKAQPNFAPGFAGLGSVYEATNDLKDAQAAYQAAVKIDPNNFAASNGLQRVNMVLGK